VLGVGIDQDLGALRAESLPATFAMPAGAAGDRLLLDTRIGMACHQVNDALAGAVGADDPAIDDFEIVAMVPLHGRSRVVHRALDQRVLNMRTCLVHRRAVGQHRHRPDSHASIGKPRIAELEPDVTKRQAERFRADLSERDYHALADLSGVAAKVT
jgi:hypothetical protein